MYPSSRPVYLDNNATTALDPTVLQTMMPWLTNNYGNAASNSHSFGWEAQRAVEQARMSIAHAINAASPSDIIFTSGATEANNLALNGLQLPPGRSHIITPMIEHRSVLACCVRLAAQGTPITYLRPQSDGIVSLNELNNALRPETGLVSVMAANNETGTLQKIEEIGALCRDRGILFHTDATQAFGKIALDVQRMNISLAAFSAHKIYGPKGVGALYVNTADERLRLSPQIVGGGQEHGLRSGTLNVPGIVGFGRAAEIAMINLPSELVRLSGLRNRLKQALFDTVPNISINGHPHECLPGVLNIAFSGVDASSLLLELPDIALSSASACSSKHQTPSHVLQAMGASVAQIQASVRISIGRFNNEKDIVWAGGRLIDAVSLLRSMAPIPQKEGK
ncbi:cysteine desulfurase family protein [Pantoea phytobeneficialis]|uniref:cysteine desulfurase n=1 Tax=Pantoea phytobeneficialis TaxID=2052056 RepID=A0AAP9KRR3_9GAMM|nr:cysteine desulfurase family protein [Pantoea phytobeneficialis]MDO6409415.1 cysteine desulfurase family protein [Pantoea phytobeneficialis]QGR09386.1 IscS subfamily cysteine desulfurase [Pantoea phytobeneficialis]